MNKRTEIFMYHRGEIVVVLENVDPVEIDSLVKSLNMLSDYGEVYYKQLTE